MNFFVLSKVFEKFVRTVVINIVFESTKFATPCIARYIRFSPLVKYNSDRSGILMGYLVVNRPAYVVR